MVDMQLVVVVGADMQLVVGADMLLLEVEVGKQELDWSVALK